jgi:hypothetical protein
MSPPIDLERLRRAWAAREPLADAEADADADADALLALDAASGALPPDEVARLLDRAHQDPAFAEAWRLARAYAAAENAGVLSTLPEASLGPPPAAPAVLRGPARWFQRVVLPTVGVLAAAAGLLISLRPPEGPPVWRGEDAAAIEVVTGAELDARAPRLAWRGPPGALWSVRVSTSELRLLVEAHGLIEPHFTLPAEALAELPDGAALLWQVEGQLPSGEALRSETLHLTLRR